MQSELHAARLTPRGRGAVASVRVTGDLAVLEKELRPLFRAANGRAIAEQPVDRVVFGLWGGGGGVAGVDSPRDEHPCPATSLGGSPPAIGGRVGDSLGAALRFDPSHPSAPAAAPAEEVVVCGVAEDALEIHCHGGEAAVRRILDDLERRGAAIVSWNEMAAAERGILAAECDDALARATTFRTAEILLEQRSGVLRNAVITLMSRGVGTARGVVPRGALAVSARATSATSNESDAPRHERPTTLDSHCGAFSNGTSVSTGGMNPPAHCSTLDALLGWADFGRHLVAPWEVVLVGRPNVGKSSLANALLGFSRSIVFDQPGTTRDVVTAETALDGWPVRFADTAGLRDAPEELEAAGIVRVRELLARADLLVLLVDVGRPPDAVDRELLVAHPAALRVAHKCDLEDRWGDALPADALRVSSRTGEGVDELAEAIVGRLVPRIPPPGTPIPFTDRQISLLQDARAALEHEEQRAFESAAAELLGAPRDDASISCV
ncbi:MAG: GTPase [Planctomycetaceae bacterium]